MSTNARNRANSLHGDFPALRRLSYKDCWSNTTIVLSRSRKASTLAVSGPRSAGRSRDRLGPGLAIAGFRPVASGGTWQRSPESVLHVLDQVLGVLHPHRE